MSGVTVDPLIIVGKIIINIPKLVQKVYCKAGLGYLVKCAFKNVNAGKMKKHVLDISIIITISMLVDVSFMLFISFPPWCIFTASSLDRNIRISAKGESTIYPPIVKKPKTAARCKVAPNA